MVDGKTTITLIPNLESTAQLILRLPTFEQLKRGAAARGHVRHLVLGAPLGAAGCRVAAANNGGGALLGHLHNQVHYCLGAAGELLKLKHAARSEG